MGRVVEGEFDIVDGTIRALRAAPWTVETLRRLRLILEEARDENLAAEQVAKRVEAEVPELATVGEVLREPKIDVKWWITFVLMVLALLVPHLDASNAPSASDMERAFEQALRDVGRPPKSVVTAPKPITRHVDRIPGRNDPCWCGSGAKYKRCHGR